MYWKKGLTLLELLMVIVIVVVLVSGTLIGFRAINIKAQDKEAQVKLRTILAAADVYRARFGTYPTSLDPTGTTSLVGQGYIQDPNPTVAANVLRTNWVFSISGASGTSITAQATAKAGTVVQGRSFSVNKTISGGTVTITSAGPPGAGDWYNQNK